MSGVLIIIFLKIATGVLLLVGGIMILVRQYRKDQDQNHYSTLPITSRLKRSLLRSRVNQRRKKK